MRQQPKGSGLITVPVPRSHEVLKRHDSRDPWRIEQKPVRLLQYLLWMYVPFLSVLVLFLSKNPCDA